MASLASPAALVTLLLGYALLCSALRFRREKAMRRRFKYPDRASLAGMTSTDAQGILEYVMTYEFPYVYLISLQFAIFKTYAFPSMSKLMAATKSFSNPKTAPKRYEDTTILFGQFQLNPPTSELCIKAIARMNYLHSQYKNAGQISNADFLYTLAVCIKEPIHFINLYEWRRLNEMEVNAMGCFWKALGDAMDIQYKGFLAKETWKDGIEFVDDITAWAKTYEVEAMKPALTNKVLAGALVDLLVYHVPRPLKPFVLEVMTVIMGDRARDAFLYPAPSLAASLTAYTALAIRGFVMRFLMLPRATPVRYFSDPDPATGRIQHLRYLVEPHYLRGTLWNRWGPEALITRLLGGHVPGSDGKRFTPDGFLFEDLGPPAKMGKGQHEMQEWEALLKQERTSGCPFVQV